MPVFQLLNYPVKQLQPDPLYEFAHQDSHKRVIQAIADFGGPLIQFRQIYPFSESDQLGILLRHQQMHDDINAFFGFNGVDLRNLDVTEENGRMEWGELNFREHQSWETALGL